jgi:RNA polymerase sigma factor (sigma-70 family)
VRRSCKRGRRAARFSYDGQTETETNLTEPAGAGGFEAFYRDALDPVYRAVLLATRHPERAEDAVQEAFARALERWDQVSVHASPRAWVIRVALNFHRSSWRVWQREAPEPPEIAVDDELPIDPWLLRAVWRLPKRQRQVVALRILLDLSAEQTADVLGITAGAVGAHLHRALGTLRTLLSATVFAEVTE